MTEEQKQALLEHIETDLELLRNVTLKHCHEVERECVLRDIEVNEIALAALTAQPDSWKQRAEAAEHERDCHMDIAEHFKARCKEFEQQKHYGYVHNLVNPPGGGVAASIFKEESRHYGRPVFTRPAPAINLAELVPPKASMADYYENVENPNLVEPDEAGITMWDACRAAILRNIEEAK